MLGTLFQYYCSLNLNQHIILELLFHFFDFRIYHFVYGVISNRTIRAKHPFVTDLDKEEKQIKKEEEEANEYLQAFSKIQDTDNEGIKDNEE